MTKGKGRKVWVEMLDSESHRFEPGDAPVHLTKGTRIAVDADLAKGWVSIGLAKKIKAPRATEPESTTKGTTKGGGE